MSEIELKFQIPAQKYKALCLAFQRKKPETVQLQAKYFDTADCCLQQRKIALRQRLENHTWMQTLKAPKNAIERLEIESELGEQEPAAIDLAMYLQDAKLKKLLEPLLQPQNPL
ncbi:MAG: CYTH domain-containing protein, partial [Acinetobacter sp.]|nr:CYTH domain-containing protein [Acinetobacter sp.]